MIDLVAMFKTQKNVVYEIFDSKTYLVLQYWTS